MKANTKKFLNTYFEIFRVEQKEVFEKFERVTKEKELNKLNSDIVKFGSKVTEDEFYFLSDLCCTWEEFKDCYQN